MISHMTDRILPIAKEWQNRPLERKYAIVFMDAVHFHVREDNRTVKKAVDVAIGVKSVSYTHLDVYKRQEQMGRTPPWAKGLLLRADGYECQFYKKD